MRHRRLFLRALAGFERVTDLGIAATIDLTADAERVRSADRIVLPGVGREIDGRGDARLMRGA
ncbi:MAG: hypothetical protein E5X14_30700, partial [Mesorhizobium sp.]